MHDVQNILRTNDMHEMQQKFLRTNTQEGGQKNSKERHEMTLCSPWTRWGASSAVRWSSTSYGRSTLYADDVILFCHPSPEDTLAVKEILQLFGRASGLRVNFQKSTATLIRCDMDLAAPTLTNLACPIVDLPITYLGIPLTIRRPTAAQLQFLVDKTAGKLPTWKAHLMDKAGRLAFVKAILSAIPIHQLLVLGPPKRIIKLLEKIQRGFLWAARADANGGHCQVNWRRLTRPIHLGGLGVRDLEQTGLTLRTRWLWYSNLDDDRAWSDLVYAGRTCLLLCVYLHDPGQWPACTFPNHQTKTQGQNCCRRYA